MNQRLSLVPELGNRERASWLVVEFGELDAERFDLMMRALFEMWAEEFEESRPTNDGAVK